MFKRALGIDIPITFIGDMPKRLMSYGEWRLLKIDVKDAKCGDLLFVRNKNREKLLSHVAVFLEADRIFHCCAGYGTAVIQSSKEFFSQYEQVLNFQKMIRYIDTRNKDLRTAQNGSFILD